MPDTDDSTDEPTVACTLTETEARARREGVREELLSHYEGAQRLEEGYRLRFAGGAESLETVAAFVAREAECCSFASFELAYEPPHEHVELTFSGPEGTADLLEEGFFSAFEEVARPS